MHIEKEKSMCQVLGHRVERTLNHSTLNSHSQLFPSPGYEVHSFLLVPRLIARVGRELQLCRVSNILSLVLNCGTGLFQNKD